MAGENSVALVGVCLFGNFRSAGLFERFLSLGAPKLHAVLGGILRLVAARFRLAGLIEIDRLGHGSVAEKEAIKRAGNRVVIFQCRA